MSNKREKKLTNKKKEELKEEEEEKHAAILPECQICNDTINIKNHLVCPKCTIEWCTGCIRNWLVAKDYCTNCKCKIIFKNLKPNYGLSRMLENIERLNYKRYCLDDKSIENNHEEDPNKVICENHKIESTSFCKTCETVFCMICLKEGKHISHDLSGDIDEIFDKNKEEAISAINCIIDSYFKIKENIDIVKCFILNKDTSQNNYESILLIYSSYFNKANNIHDDFNVDLNADIEVALNKLESFNSSKFSKSVENIQIMKDTAISYKKLATELDFLTDLDRYTKMQKIECNPFLKSEATFCILLKTFRENNSDMSIWIKDNKYIITFEKIDYSDLHRIVFTWIDPPEKWSYDLKLNLFVKLNQNCYAKLNHTPVIISPCDKPKVLCLFNISDICSNLNKSINKSEESKSACCNKE